jgi:hypothetical protein
MVDMEKQIYVKRTEIGSRVAKEKSRIAIR